MAAHAGRLGGAGQQDCGITVDRGLPSRTAARAGAGGEDHRVATISQQPFQQQGDFSVSAGR